MDRFNPLPPLKLRLKWRPNIWFEYISFPSITSAQHILLFISIYKTKVNYIALIVYINVFNRTKIILSKMWGEKVLFCAIVPKVYLHIGIKRFRNQKKITITLGKVYIEFLANFLSVRLLLVTTKTFILNREVLFSNSNLDLFE